MSPMFFSIVVTAAMFGQTADDDSDAARERNIRAAIRQLGAKEYSSREQAHRQLWRHGTAAESALKQAAKSRDGETRLRAQRLLRDFEYGIVPGVDADTQQLIRDFRDGGQVARKAAFERFVQRQRITLLERLIRLEPDPQVRRLLLGELFEEESLVDHFIQRDRVDALVAAVGIDQDEAWRRSVTIQLMFAPNSLSRLAETGSLGKLLQLIRDETDAQVRQSMLVAIFRTPGVGVVLARNELGFVLDALRAEPDQKFRGALLGEIFANPQSAEAIVAHNQLDLILDFSREHTDAANQQKLIERMLASAPVLTSLLKEGGLDRVIALVSKEADPVRRGRLLGATISQSVVRTYLQQNGLSEVAIKLAKDEQNADARHEFLKALLHDTSFAYSINSEETVAQLWQLIKADQNAAWRAQALIVLLQSHRSNALLQNREEAAWILNMATDDASGPVREDILRFLLPNLQAQRALIAAGHFETMLKLARELPIRSRGEILGNFIAGQGVAEHLVASNQVELLIMVARDEPDATVKQLCLQGIFRNSAAMSALLAAGHYATFRELIQSDEDAARRASLFGAFVWDARVMEEIAKRGDAKLLLNYAESDDEAARQQFLPRLFQNRRAVTLLMEEGHFERLLVLAKQDGGTNFDEFLVVPKVIEHLVATKQFNLFLDFASEEADDNTRRNLLRNIFSSSTNVEALITAGDFSRLLRLIQAERDPTWRTSLLGPVISSAQVVTHFAATKRLDLFLSMISDEREPVVRARLMMYLTNRSATLTLLIENGTLDALIDLVNGHLTGQRRGTTLATVVTNLAALKQLKAERRVGLLLSFTDDTDDTFAATYVSRLFMVSQATDLLVEEGYYRDLFEIATTNREANVRASLIGRLLYSQKAIEQMIARGDVATLVSIIKEESDSVSRRAYLTTICGNDRLVEEMLKSKLFESLLQVIQSERDVVTRSRQLATLVYSAKVIATLSADGQLSQILDAAIADSDAKIREGWLSNVFRRSTSFEALVKLGYGETLLDAVEKGIPVATQQSLLRSAFSNSNVVRAMIAKGHFERLLASAKRHGGRQLAQLLRSSVVIEHLAAKKRLSLILESTQDELEANAKYGVLYALVQNETARKSLLAAGHFETLCRLIQSVPEPSQQNSLFAAMFSSIDVVRHHADTETLDQFFAYIDHKATPTARTGILSAVLIRSDAVDLLIEQGYYEALLRVSEEHTHGEMRERLLAQLLTAPKALAKLVADEKVDTLLARATDAEGLVSLPFVGQLLSNRTAVSLLIDRGHFTDLYRLATASSDANSRTQLLGKLLINAKAIEQLIASDQLAAVVSYANDETNLDSRRAYLGRICHNRLLIIALARTDLFDEFVKACESDPDADERRRLFASFLLSEAAIRELVKAERLESIVVDSLAEPDKTRRQSWLNSVLASSDAFATLIDHGFGDRILAEAEKNLNASQLQSVYRAMISSSTVISAFANSGRHSFLLKLADDDQREGQYPYVLSRIASNEDAMRAMTKAGELDNLLERVAKVEKDSTRESLQRQLLGSDGTLSALAEQDKLLTLFEMLQGAERSVLRRNVLQSLILNDRRRSHLADMGAPTPFVTMIADEEERYRTSYVARLLSDSNLRRRWIEAGNLSELKRLVALSPSENARAQALHNLLYTPSGVLGHLLRQENFEDAEALLHRHSGDRAMSWLVSYRTSRSQLASEIARLQQKEAPSRSAYETRLLVYLLRASGDLEGATKIAESIDEPRLLRPLLVEQQRWAEAAVLQARAPLDPPVALVQGLQQDENTNRIEQLGLLASYHRMGGDESATEKVIDDILTFAETNKGDSQLVWHAAQALLLNDGVDEGLRLVRDSRPLVAFALYSHRQDYPSAFESIGLNGEFVADRKWYDALPFGTAQGDVQRRFLFAIDVARTLRSTGREEAAKSVLTLLESIIAETPARGRVPTQNYLWQWYSGGLYRTGWKDRAWSAAANVIDPRATYPPGVLSDIFGSRAFEARAWWALFHHQHGIESPESILRRVDDVLHPPSAEAVNLVPDLVRQAISFGESGQNETYWRGVADTCIALGQQDCAIECFERIPAKSHGAIVAHADLLFSATRWADAADLYYEAWSRDCDQLSSLFLAGIAKQRAGADAKGLSWQSLADLQAITPKARHQLALALAQRGLDDAANGQWQTLLRTAPFESLELNDAARQLAMNAYGDEPEPAAWLWQHYLLGDVRPAFWLLNDVSYLSVPALAHKLRAMAAIGRSDFEAAERSMRLGLALCPGDTLIAEELVPLLDAANQREIADDFVAQVVEHYETLCEAYPLIPQLHNNLAWAMARCHRQLDEALLHAQKAVELEPNNAGFVDTLAEVHFHLGDRDTAIQLSERAVALRPLGKSLQAQLGRFRSAPLPTP